MADINNKKLGLLVIDLQNEYFRENGPLEVPDGMEVINKAKTVIKNARKFNIPIFHIRHISKDPLDSTFRAGTSMVEFMEEVKPEKNEIIITKNRPGAFYLTELDDQLKKESIGTVAIMGLLSFMCVDTTAREAHARGYDVLFIKDATASIDIGEMKAKEIHKFVCTVQGWYFSDVIKVRELINIMEKTNGNRGKI